MPKNNKQECTEKIHKLIPDIFESGIRDVYIDDFRNPIDAQKYINKFINKKYVEIIPVHEDKEHGYTSVWVKIETIDRPIQLSDVLRAIDQNKKWPPIALSSSGLFLEKSKDDIRANAPYLSSCISYNLSLPFDQQSEEFYHFLNNIL